MTRLCAAPIGCLGRCGLMIVPIALAAARLAAQPTAGPLTPQQALSSFHFADEELAIELVASEPEVVSPVAITWDADGRLFVAEMLDYPNATNGSRIKLLEDRDGDGRYERAAVFAEKLPFPNGVLPWNGGVLVTAAPDILFLKDNDGDGRADERRVLLTGFGEGNQQLRVNGLFWGIDNWVYGANGRSDGEIHTADKTGKTVSLRGKDFRFRPGSGEFEAIAGRSQFGATRDDWGNRFLSWNTIPIRHEVLPERYLNRNANLAGTESVLDILSPGDDGRVFPLAPPPLVFNNESSSHFNALAGLTIYRGDALGEKYRGNAFVGESLRNLVHRRVLMTDGVTFIAKRGENGTEFLASDDPWFHPVNFATGPDGALYVVDFYRRFVEHPGFVPETLRAQIAWRTGAEHGRIWRIAPRNGSRKARSKSPRLGGAPTGELVKELGNPNAWWRDTAQRIIVERRDPAVVPLLRAVIRDRKSAGPFACLGALWTLEGLGKLDEGTLLSALHDSEPGIREHAVRLAEGRLSSSQHLSRAACALKDDANVRVRFQLALSLGEWESEARLVPLAQIAQHDFADQWIASAILSSVGKMPGLLLRKLAQEDPRWLAAPSPEQAKMLDRIARLLGEQNDETELAGCLSLLAKSGLASSSSAHLPFLAGLADGLARSPRSLLQLMSSTKTNIEVSKESISQWVKLSAEAAASSVEATDRRLLAVRVLAHLQPDFGGKVLLELLQPQQPAEIQSAAVEALVGLRDRELARELFASWKQYAPATRRQLLAVAPRSPVALVALIEALEGGLVLADEIAPSTQVALRQIKNPELERRVKKFVEISSTETREQVVNRFQPALHLTGDRGRGAATFVKLCLTCHAIAGKGNRVGPDLSGIATRPREALLVDILDPSRQVTPDFISYTLTTKEGGTETGLLAAESANSITLRRAGQADETFLRTQITGLRADSKSLMPEGLEQGLSVQDMADLLDFLQNPDQKLLPETK